MSNQLDLDDAADNLEAIIKIQADASGGPVLTGFPGQAWGWVGGEGHKLLFNTYGIGATRVEKVGDDWRFYHREVLYYLDPKTGEVLHTWQNPYTGRTVEVLHIMNDPVNRLYQLKGGPIPPPRPYIINGPFIVFQISVLRAEKHNPLMPAEYPLHAQQDVYQSAEMWAISSVVDQVKDRSIKNADNHTAWTRLSMWLPFMEMGQRPGQMVYASNSFKLKNKVADLPKAVLEYTEKHHPKYLEPPSEWQGLSVNENTWSYSKKFIDARRAEGKVKPDGSVFAIS